MRTATSCGREPLVDTIIRFLAHERVADRSAVRVCVERAIDESGPDALESLSARLLGAGAEWDLLSPRSSCPAHPSRSRAARAAAGACRHGCASSRCGQGQALGDLREPPLVLRCECRGDHAAECWGRLAGRSADRDCRPEGVSNVMRRFSSLCFGTIKVPQSSERSSEDAVMNPRDVARAARRAIQIAQERLSLGEALLIFAEGSRSRTGQMQEFLPGTARYLELPDTWVLPIGLAGTEKLFPIDASALHAVPITMSIGRPILASDLRERVRKDRRLMMDGDRPRSGRPSSGRISRRVRPVTLPNP